MDIVVLTNSPGELSSWVRATVEPLRERRPHARIVIMLVPCPFASGGEARIAKSLKAVDLVLQPRNFMQCILGLPITGYTPSPRGVVVMLGGDFWHAQLVSRRLRFPVVAYTQVACSWPRHTRLTAVSDETVKQKMLAMGVPAERISVVGNLVGECVRPQMTLDEARERFGLQPDHLTVGFMPGSRPAHARVSLTVFLKVAEELSRALNGRVQFLLGQSPFLTDDHLVDCLKPLGEGAVPGVTGTLEGEYIHTEGGVKVRRVSGLQYDLMNVSDLVLTIPGTNTAEGAVLGTPMIVCMTWRAPIPRGGLGAITTFLPMYSNLRKSLLMAMLRRIKFTALPNIMAGRHVIPEICVDESSMEITEVALRLLQDEVARTRMRGELKALLSPNGAATRMADHVDEILEEVVAGGAQSATRVASARVGL